MTCSRVYERARTVTAFDRHALLRRMSAANALDDVREVIVARFAVHAFSDLVRNNERRTIAAGAAVEEVIGLVIVDDPFGVGIEAERPSQPV